MDVIIRPNEKNDHEFKQGKLGDAELHFTDGPLAGLKLIGFGIWLNRASTGRACNITWPARTYSVNGERRSFALLRPITDASAQDAVRDLIIAAWKQLAEKEGL